MNTALTPCRRCRRPWPDTSTTRQVDGTILCHSCRNPDFLEGSDELYQFRFRWESMCGAKGRWFESGDRWRDRAKVQDLGHRHAVRCDFCRPVLQEAWRTTQFDKYPQKVVVEATQFVGPHKPVDERGSA